MTSVWFQAEFYSPLEKCWIPLGARAETEAGAREAYEHLTKCHQRRIVKVTHTKFVLESEER